MTTSVMATVDHGVVAKIKVSQTPRHIMELNTYPRKYALTLHLIILPNLVMSGFNPCLYVNISPITLSSTAAGDYGA